MQTSELQAVQVGRHLRIFIGGICTWITQYRNLFGPYYHQNQGFSISLKFFYVNQGLKMGDFVPCFRVVIAIFALKLNFGPLNLDLEA